MMQQLAETPTVTEHDVAQHNETPAVAQQFDRHVDRTPGATVFNLQHLHTIWLRHTISLRRLRLLLQCNQIEESYGPVGVLHAGVARWVRRRRYGRVRLR